MKNARPPYVNITFRVPSLFRCFRFYGMELVAEDLQAQTPSNALGSSPANGHVYPVFDY